MVIEYWFLKKQFEGRQREDAQLFEPQIIRKSDKAFLMEWDIPMRGSFRCWVPKKAVKES